MSKEEKVRNKKGKEQVRGGTKYRAAAIAVEEPPEIRDFVNTIIVGDAEEVLRALPAGSVDMVITSPPYNFGHSYAGDHTEDTREWNEYFDKLYRIWAECYRILKPGGRIAVNVQPLFSDYIPTHHIISHQLQRLGFLWKAEILWEKSNYNAKYTAWGSWQSPSMPYIKYTWEFIEVFDKATHRKVGPREAIDITADEFKEWVYGRWNIAPEGRMKEFGHPAMFPEEIPYRLMRLFTYRGDIVVDPFNGAGTTTVVAYRLRRRFIGIDISPEYCRTAYERVCREAAQKPLFEYSEGGEVILSAPYPDPRLLAWENQPNPRSTEYAGRSRS
ncbi:MAG: site-specific DNA-methyltransferase [Anaerolineae bacterium]|nr:site-specific DNA-methyltransferase [Anaerolineae bacterium]MDW8067697.1 site-specific DNA-methyltransferase [Anaerolineae bacterium]